MSARFESEHVTTNAVAIALIMETALHPPRTDAEGYDRPKQKQREKKAWRIGGRAMSRSC
jgi:hypothetical protein